MSGTFDVGFKHLMLFVIQETPGAWPSAAFTVLGGWLTAQFK